MWAAPAWHCKHLGKAPGRRSVAEGIVTIMMIMMITMMIVMMMIMMMMIIRQKCSGGGGGGLGPVSSQCDDNHQEPVSHGEA